MLNRKQQIVIVLSIIALALIVIFTPKYKITWIDATNFIRTEQTSSLYKRSHGQECYHWEKIALYGSATIVLCAILLLALKERKEKNVT